jgi:hypothetical protein
VYDQNSGSCAQNGWFSEFQLPLKTIILFFAGFFENLTLCAGSPKGSLLLNGGFLVPFEGFE